MIVELVLSFTVLFIQILGLILLYRQKNRSKNKNQIYLLIAICHTASILAVLTILNPIKSLPKELLWFPEIYFRILYHVFMTLFTLDRFLVFYLTIKYPIYCTPKKLLKIIYTVVMFTAIFVLILVVLFLCKIMFLEAQHYSVTCSDYFRYSLYHRCSYDIHIYFCGL